MKRSVKSIVILFLFLNINNYLYSINSLSYYTISINEVMVSNNSSYVDDFSESDDWIELYNYGSEAVDINGLNISDKLSKKDKFQITESMIIGPDSYFVLWADNQVTQGANHLNFKLSEGDYLTISIPEGVIDQVDITNKQSNVSLGRQPDGLGFFKYFSEATPKNSNSAIGYVNVLSKPVVSHNSGTYSDQIEVGLTSLENGEIRYTLDGLEPTELSDLYTSPISINTKTILRTKVYKDDYIPSEVSINTYVYDLESSGLPILYLTSNDLKFNDADVKVHVNLTDEYGKVLFSQYAGAQSHGDEGQTSFKLFFRSEYGDNEVENELFPHKPGVDGFRRLIFRQAGNDGLRTSGSKRSHIRDGLISTIVNQGDFKFKAPGFRPVTVFFNGEYYGLFNMRERVDKYFIENNYGYDADAEKCLVEYRFGHSSNMNVIEGSLDYYRDNLWIYANENDLSNPVNYNQIKKFIDLEDFTDYWIHQVFVGNYDWLANNLYVWGRLNNLDTKFRWILWDTDIGLGFKFSSYGDPNWNTLNWATSETSDRSWNGSRTRIIRGLLKNEEYRNYFITRFCDLLNKEYVTENTHAILNEIAGGISSEVLRYTVQSGRNSLSNWESEIEVIRNYLTERPGNVRNHIKTKFGLGEMYDLSLSTSIEGAGVFSLNTIDVSSSVLPWSGRYFNGLDLEVTVYPKEGYEFVGWEGYDEVSTTIHLNPNAEIALVAMFEEIEPLNSGIVINEISYEQNDLFDSGDWVELYNNSGVAIDLSGWMLKDGSDDNVFVLPLGTVMEVDEYITLCNDLDDFQKVYPNVINVLGEFDFGFSKSGESIRLFDGSQELMDFVLYKNDVSWPVLGEASSIYLVDVGLDNSQGRYWEVSGVGATPGGNNGVVSILNREESFNFVIYPNPAEGVIHFEVSSPGEVLINNMQGQNKLKTYVEYGINDVDLSFLSKGMYIVTIMLENGAVESKQLVLN